MPLYTGTTIQEVGRKAPNTIKGKKREKIKKDMIVKVTFLSARKKL